MTHLRIEKQKGCSAVGETLAEVYNVTPNEIPKVGSTIRVNGVLYFVCDIVNSYEPAESLTEFGLTLDPKVYDAWLIVEV